MAKTPASVKAAILASDSDIIFSCDRWNEFSVRLKPVLLSIRTYEVKAGVSVMFESRDISFAGAGDAPDSFRAVVGDQQRAIGCDRHAYRAAPHVFAIYHKTGHEVFILARGFAGLMEWNADELVSDARGAIPGAVFGGEDITFVFVRK